MSNAVKPFGAIDTPGQGETAYGTNYINWGWVLTPQPNYIPTDGSTINVWVDGVNLGNPVYNIYRSDIAAFFPGYANSGGAFGSIIFDTTQYHDGVHTIQWSVRDSGDNTDGIGSRYFSIENGRGRSLNRAAPFDEIPADYTVPVQYRTGYDESAPMVNISPDSNDVINISILETDRLEVSLNETGFTGYSNNNDIADSLPIGSTLDESGTFYWIPGPGFLGTFELVFVRGVIQETKKVIRVTIANP